MANHVNVFVPLACPRCGTDLYSTLDDIQQMAEIRCSRCGTSIELRPESLPFPTPSREALEQSFDWPTF